MCLDAEGLKVLKKQDRTIRIGYKFVSRRYRSEGVVYSPNTFPGHGIYFRVGKWTVDKPSKKKIRVGRWQEHPLFYPRGFHIYATKYGSWGSFGPLAKVAFRRVVAVGKQRGRKVYVAKELKILKIMRDY